MNKNNLPIGIFDSGLGGLTVLKEIERILPKESIIYFGDTARVPYGNKSKNTIIRFSTENILFLLRKKVKIIVVACNTSSSLALGSLKEIFTVPLIGVIQAGVEKACAVCRGKGIGIIGTKSTISSRSYQENVAAVNSINPVRKCPDEVLGSALTKAVYLPTSRKSAERFSNGIKVYARACPLFVPLVEENLTDGKIVDLAVKMYLADFRGKIDTLILGCTHYPLLEKPIARYLRGVNLVDSAKEVALRARDILKKLNLLNKSGYPVREKFYVTDEPKAFSQRAEIFLRRRISNPQVVDV